MTDPVELLKHLDRPRLLVSAARIGLADYNRQSLLRRLFHDSVPAGSEATLARLLMLEARMDAARRAGGADYIVARHVELLIALMGEARLLLAARARPIPADAGRSGAMDGSGAVQGSPRAG